MDGSGMFFTYENDLPPGTGYALFHREHLLIIAACFLLLLIFVFLYKKCTPERKERLRSAAGWILLLLIILRLVYVALCGAKILYELPLHLCSLSGILCFLHSLLSRDSRPERSGAFLSAYLGQVLYSLGMPGALLAILFPNGNMYPPIHFITIQSFLFHTLIVIYVICCLSDRLICPSLRASLGSILFLIVLVPLVFAFNTHFGTNYMFLQAPSAGSPIFFIMERFGYTGYLTGYALLAVAEILLINLIGSLFADIARKKG